MATLCYVLNEVLLEVLVDRWCAEALTDRAKLSFQNPHHPVHISQFELHLSNFINLVKCIDRCMSARWFSIPDKNHSDTCFFTTWILERTCYHLCLKLISKRMLYKRVWHFEICLPPLLYPILMMLRSRTPSPNMKKAQKHIWRNLWYAQTFAVPYHLTNMQALKIKTRPFSHQHFYIRELLFQFTVLNHPSSNDKIISISSSLENNNRPSQFLKH